MALLQGVVLVSDSCLSMIQPVAKVQQHGPMEKLMTIPVLQVSETMSRLGNTKRSKGPQSEKAFIETPCQPQIDTS